MKPSLKIAAGIAAALGLALATAASAHPGWQGAGPCATYGAGYGMGPGGGYGPHAGMGPGGYGPGAGMGPGGMGRGGGYGPGAGMGPGFGGLASQLMTPEEWAAHRDKMRNAKTPEERQQIAAANHAELQKRAAEKGITLPQPSGPRGGFGPGFRRAPQAPAETQ